MRLLFLKVSLHVQGEGSAACADRPLCSKKDYFQIHTACDQEGKVRKRRPLRMKTSWDGSVLSLLSSPRSCCTSLSFQTQVMYKWIEPKICLEGVSGAEPLPPSGEREPCPPCNPGFYNNDSPTCSPCPAGSYSDGTKRTESPDFSYYSFILTLWLIVFCLLLQQHVHSVLQAPSPP